MFAPLALLAAQARDVEFRYVAPPGVQTVAVVGQFNGWDRAAHPLRQSDDGIWAGTVAVAPGVYQYLFVLDGNQWVRDPSAPTAPDANGNQNSLLVVEPAYYDAAPAVAGDGRLTRSALRHDPALGDRLRKSAGAVLLRLRTRRGDAREVAVELAGRKARLRKVGTDPLYDTWQGVARPQPGVARYRFLVDGQPAGAFEWDWQAEPLPKAPSWLDGAVVYQVFPDRFFNGDPGNDPAGTEPWGTPPSPTNWMGGDLQGVAAKLDHLVELGVTAVYLNPVFATGSNHGYTTNDYYRVDPRFGGQDGFETLAKACRERGVRILLDGVFNHSGTEFGPFRDVARLGRRSRYADWFHLLADEVEVREGQKTYATFAGVWQMPKLATHRRHVQEFVAGVGAYWLEAGAGGWRLDVADEVDPECWRAFRKAVKAVDPEAYIVGEVWGDAGRWLQGDMFDGVMDYRWRQAVLELCAGRAKPSQFVETVRILAEDYPDGSHRALLNLLGSHDTERLARTIPRLERRLQAVVLQFAWPGVPCVYYGDEVGLDGGRDPDDRRCMPWDEAAWSQRMLAHTRVLAALRRTDAALGSGTLHALRADDASGLLAFERRKGKERALVLLAMGAREVRAPVPAGSRLLLGSPGAKLRAGQATIPKAGFAIVRLGKG